MDYPLRLKILNLSMSVKSTSFIRANDPLASGPTDQIDSIDSRYLYRQRLNAPGVTARTTFSAHFILAIFNSNKDPRTIYK